MYRFIKYVYLPYEDRGSTWTICPYTGSLIQEEKKKTKSVLPAKVIDALEYCSDPFLCKPYDTVLPEAIEIEGKLLNRLIRMDARFLLLGSKRFFLSRQYASFRNELFPTTREAMKAISQIPSQKERIGKLCLQKTLLALKTSKSFQEKGVLFIGALLPTVNMHAWIIESGTQPDSHDRDWIQYRPLLAFY